MRRFRIYVDVAQKMRARHLLDEAAVNLIAHMKDKDRQDMLTKWRIAAGYEQASPLPTLKTEDAMKGFLTQLTGLARA